MEKRNIQIVTSWDDGTKYDLRMAKLLREYNIPAMFYIPDICPFVDLQLTDNEVVGLGKDFEIGGHTVSHRDLTKLSDGDVMLEVQSNKWWLEEILNREVTSFCYPSGKLSVGVQSIVKNAGYREARAVGWGNTNGKHKDKYKIMPTAFVHPDDSKFGGMHWDDYAKKMLDGDGDYFHLWGHSHEVERYGLWTEVETFFKFLSTI